MQKQLIDLSEELSVKKFQDIVDFILKNGDRRTYCNMYNNNPHYKLERFDIYLNPINQGINWSEDRFSSVISDYNKIVIIDFESSATDYYITLNKNKVSLYIYNQNDISSVKKEFLLKCLPLIESQFLNY